MEQRIVDDRTLFLNQTVDPSLWKDSDIVRMAEELDRFQPLAIEADPAYLAWFAVRLEKIKRTPWQPRFIDVSYEFPSRRHVAQIERVFRAPVLDAYGSTECGFVFFECPQGRYHHNARWTHAEVIPCKTPGLEGVGVLHVTSMRNKWLNLVRFDTGDLARVLSGPCSCGREGELVLETLEGRAKDLLVRADGRAVTTRAIDRALAGIAGLLHYRVVQKTASELDLELVADGTAPLDAEAAAHAVAALMGAAPRTRIVATVPVEASGKFRLTRALHVDAEKLVRGAS
jgi:phenylacetate-CoA ligase